tara:strand:- start:1286 stop:1813 length:528 start_codon:yes stop_codon:yes gene_type:complete
MRYHTAFLFRLITAWVVVAFRGVYAPIVTTFSAYASYIPLSILFGARLSGNVISLSGKSIEYVEACSAIGAYVFLALLILLTGGIEFRKGVKLFAYGSLLILLANIIRIDVLAYLLANNNIDMFLTLHLFIWKIISGIYVALVWIFLVKKYDIKGIPLVDDFKYFLRKSFLKKGK